MVMVTGGDNEGGDDYNDNGDGDDHNNNADGNDGKEELGEGRKKNQQQQKNKQKCNNNNKAIEIEGKEEMGIYIIKIRRI